MLLKLNQPLKFILKPNLTEFEVVSQNGVFIIKTKDFKQILKTAEYQEIKSLYDSLQQKTVSNLKEDSEETEEEETEEEDSEETPKRRGRRPKL